MVWAKFVLCLVIILISGTKLSRYGHAIAEKTGLGGLWIGLVLLATITSMPEVATGLGAAALVKGPDLALGTIFGSNLFNLAILALLDTLHHPMPMLSRASPRHIASAGLGILFIAIAAGGIFAGDQIPGLALGRMGILSIIILVFYLLGVRGLFHFERARGLQPLPVASLQYEAISKGTVYLKFAIAALAVVGAGIWLSFVGNEIAEVTGWGTSFVGSLFLAITSSMPELVVTITALRLGAIDMAVADVLGSNMFNMASIALVDLFYTQGPIFSAVSSNHLITAAMVAVMSLLAIVGLCFRAKHKTFVVVSWYAPLLIGLYILGAYALFSGAEPALE